MRRAMKRSAAVLGFIIIAAACLHKLYDVLRWKDTTGGYLSSIDQLYNTDKGLIDVAFLGSSHCYSGIYPEVLWEERGIAGFDMAVSAQDRNSTYHQLKELLKTQRPKVVMADIYGACFERHLLESNEYRNYLSMKTSLNSFAHVTAYIEKERQKDFLTRWPIVHTRYRELKEFDFAAYEPNVIGKGSLISWRISAVEEDNGINRCREAVPASAQNQQWIQDMIVLSEENGFELVFMLVPWKRDDDWQATINGLKEYIRGTGIDFVDLAELSESLDIRSETDWMEAEHLNARGALKITRYLGEYLATRYELPDRREDPRYFQWEKALERYHQLEMLDQLNSISDMKEYISLLTDIPRITCILSLEGNYAGSPTGIYAYASEFQMDYQDYLRGGKWLYQDGRLEKICENVPGEESIRDLSEIDTLKVCFQENFSSDNVLIDGVPYGIAWDGLRIIVYDNIEKKVILTKEIH